MHRSNGRGTLMIDRVFDGIGRVRRASGTMSKAVKKELEVMLSAFASQGRHDLLGAIQDGTVPPLFALTYFRQSRLDRIPLADVLPPLGASYDAWVKAFDCSAEHTRSLQVTRRALEIEDRHILRDAPDLLEAYRARSLAHPSSFNKAKAHLQAFLRDTLGKDHQLWRQVAGKASAKVVKGPPRNRLSPDEVRRLVVQLGPDHGAIAWSLAATGMGPKEFWGEWEVLPDRVQIWGTKRKGRNRAVPRWTGVEKPTRSFSRFKVMLRKGTGGKVTPYDFRRAFARWCEEAGILSINTAAYMGHGAKSMTDHYKLGELPGQFAADADRLRAYAGEPGLIPTLKVSVSA